MSQMKALVKAFQSTQSPPFGQIMPGNSSPGRGRGSWKGRGNGRWRSGSRGRGQSQKHLCGDGSNTELSHTDNTTNTRVAPEIMGPVRSINLDNVGSVGRLDTLGRIALY